MNLSISAGVKDLNVKSQARGSDLQVLDEGLRQSRGRVNEHEIARVLRHQLPDQPKSLGRNVGIQRGGAGDIAAGSAEAGDKTKGDNVAADGEDDGNRSGG